MALVENIASRSRVRIAQVVETTRGTLPTNPAYKVVPHRDNSALNQSQTFERSTIVKSNRMGGLQVGGTLQAGGTLSFPLMLDSAVKELIESAIGGAFAAIVVTGQFDFVDGGGGADTITLDPIIPAASSVALDATAKTITRVSGSWITDGVRAGDVLVLANAEDVGNNGNKTVKKVVSATVVEVDTLATTNADDDTITIHLSLITRGLEVGDLITISNAANAANNFTAAITALTHTVITVATGTVTADTDDAITITTARLRAQAGTSRKFFSYEVRYADTDPIEYEYFYGMEVNTMTINVPTSGEVFADCEMVGVDALATQSQQGGTPTFTGPDSVVPFAGSVTGSQLKEAGVALVGVETLSLTLNNNRAAKFQIGSRLASHVEEGDFDLETQMSIYFTDGSLQAKFLNGTRTSLVIVVADQSDGHKLRITVPELVFTGGEKGLSGQTIVQNMPGFAEEAPVPQLIDGGLVTVATKAIIDWIPSS